MRKILLLFCLCLTLVSNAQDIFLPKSVPTPNAASLGRYADIPMSYYTGRADVTIPLFELNVRGVSMPISLTYDTSGLLMNSLPSWTGHNWTLNAGGVITRTINNRPDEYQQPAGLHTTIVATSYFKAFNSLQKSMDTHDYLGLQDSAYYGHTDTSPDVFYFNFMGKSGRFFLGSDGHWKVLSNENIEVVFDINDENNFLEPFINRFPNKSFATHQPKTIKGFLLIDENGTRYHFGGNHQSIEYSLNIEGMSDLNRTESWDATSWYLTKVEDRFGNNLYSLHYLRGKFLVHFCRSSYFYYFETSAGVFGSTIENGTAITNSQFPYSVMFMAPVYLSYISAANGQEVDFSSSDLKISLEILYSSLYGGPKKYQLYDNLAEKIGDYEEWQYYYLQTDDSSITPYQYRAGGYNKYSDPLELTCLRRLDTIDMIYTDGWKKYELSYDMDSRMHLTSLKIIGLDTEEVDDIENGSYTFTYNAFSSLPADYLTSNVDHWGYYSTNSNREPNLNCSKAGMLYEIIYPTKGRTRFEYEQNSYDRYMSENRQSVITKSGYAGGLRIKAIRDYNPGYVLSLARERVFSYGDMTGYPGNSSGQLFAKPKYDWPQKTIYAGDVAITITRYQEESVIPLRNSFGPHIGYSYVKEERSDGTYTIYHYSNIADYKDEMPAYKFVSADLSPGTKFSERGYHRGKLLDCCVYDTFNDTVQITRNVYRTDNVEQNYVYSSNIYNRLNGPIMANIQFIDACVYKLYYPKYDLVSTSTTNYYENGTVTDKTVYNKQDVALPVYIDGYRDTVGIRKTVSETRLRAGSSFTTSFSYTYNSANALEKSLATNQFYLAPVRSEQSYNGTTVKANKTGYKVYNGKTVPAYELEYKQDASPDTLVTYLTYTQTWQIKSYREFGQPVTLMEWTCNDNYPTLKKVGDMSTVYQYNWDYSLSGVVDPNGYATYYEYDGMGRLAKIKDHNGKLVQSFEYHYRE